MMWIISILLAFKYRDHHHHPSQKKTKPNNNTVICVKMVIITHLSFYQCHNIMWSDYELCRYSISSFSCPLDTNVFSLEYHHKFNKCRVINSSSKEGSMCIFLLPWSRSFYQFARFRLYVHLDLNTFSVSFYFV